MNSQVKKYVQNIVEIATNHQKYVKDGLNLEGSFAHTSHHFVLRNIEENPVSYCCPVRSLEMALDIIELTHDELGSNFDRKYCEGVLPVENIDYDLGLFLHYYKVPDITIP